MSWPNFPNLISPTDSVNEAFFPISVSRHIQGALTVSHPFLMMMRIDSLFHAIKVSNAPSDESSLDSLIEFTHKFTCEIRLTRKANARFSHCRAWILL
jgi:hypothetical protein